MLGKALRLMKKLLFVLLILFSLLVVTVVVFVLTFDLNHYKNFTEQKLTTLLNRPVTIESMHTKLALVPTITINGFKVLNNEPFSEKEPLLSIQRMDAELELAPLLNRSINIHSITLDKADVHLFQSNDANNWTITHQRQETNATNSKNEKITSQNNLRLNTVIIKQLNMFYETEKQKHELTVNNLEITQFHMLKGEIVYKKHPFKVDLNAGTIFDFLNQTPNFPIDLKVQSRLMNMSLNGKIGNFQKLSDLQATFSFKATNLKNFANLLDINSEFIPPHPLTLQTNLIGDIDKLSVKRFNLDINSTKDFSLTATGTLRQLLKNPTIQAAFTMKLADNQLSKLASIQPMTLTGDIQANTKTLKAQQIVIDANRSDAKLTIDAQRNPTGYNINANLSSDFLDIYDFIRPQNSTHTPTAPANSTAQKTQKATEIPWDIFKRFNTNIAFNIHHLQLNNDFVEPIGVSAQLSLVNNVLKGPFEIAALQGKTTGNVSMNANTQTITIAMRGLNLNLNGIRPLQKEVKDLILDTDISLKTLGKTTLNLARNLSGHIVLQTKQGQIVNQWFQNLPKVLNLNKKRKNIAFNTTDDRILITCGAANMTINHGMIQGNNQLALETNVINLLAGGNINFNNKTADITLQPSLPDGEKTNDILSLSKFIRIAGTFNNLTPKVDTKKTATDIVQTGIQKLIGVSQESSTNTYTPGKLCQNVLGKDAITPKTATQKQSPTNKTTKSSKKAQPTQKKATQPFQQQLLDSLYQALDTQ